MAFFERKPSRMDLQSILNASDSASSAGSMDLERILREDDDEDDDILPLRSDVSAHGPRTSEDWAVLQAILGEDDEDEEEKEESWIPDTTSETSRFGRVTVDAILRAGADDSSEEEDLATMPTISTMSSPRERTFSKEYKSDDPIQPARSFEYTSRLPPRKSFHSAEASRRAIQQAQAYERKLLKAGRREIVSPLMVKRRLRPKIELSSRSTSSSGTRPPVRFAFSGVVDDKPLVADSLQQHAQSNAKVYCGLPTCLAFNSKFIAVGTQQGIVLVYDLFEVLRQRLGSQILEHWNRLSAGAVTSIDLNYNGEVLVAGYASGVLVLWDTIRGIILRSINETHTSPISGVRVLSDLKVVTVDASGLVNKLSFTRNIIWSNYSMETECLLDGTAGQILAMHVLPRFSTVNPNVRPEKLAPLLKRMTLIALTSERSSFAVAVEPVVNVLHRWARPSSEQMAILDSSLDLPEDGVYLPCLAWGWALVSGGGNVAMPILARAWGCCLQLLAASFPSYDDESPPVIDTRESVQMHWPAFGLHDEIDATVPIVALEWLSDRSLVYLTVTNEFTLVDTVMMTMLERLDFSGMKLVYAEFALSRTVSKDDGSTDEPLAPVSCITFQNSIRSSDDRLLVLCQESIRCSSIIGARRRISALEEDGEWLEALALALDHYESSVLSQEDRRRDPNRYKDFSKHPEFHRIKNDDDEWIAKLLIRYLNLAVDNAPETYVEEAGPYSDGMTQARIDLAQSHFQMLAGVCVEFCVVTRRLDLLFGAVFRKFEMVGFTSVFLDVLEPYVLNDKLSYIAPEVMAYFVDHCKASNNGLATVERCLLHMDCTIMDFDSILSLLRSNEMYTALFYVFNQGLDDYTTPLEMLLEKIFDDADTGHALLSRRGDGMHQNKYESRGYKALLYLQLSFEGKTFPQETPIESEDKVQAMKPELLRFLLEEVYRPSQQVRKHSERVIVVGQRALPFPYLRCLLQVDPRAMLEALSVVLDSPEYESVSPHDENRGTARSGSSFPKKQDVMDVLSSLILVSSDDESNTIPLARFQDEDSVNAFLDFTAKYLIRGVVRMDPEVTYMIFRRMASQFTNTSDGDARQVAQRQVMDLLSSLPRDSYDPDGVLRLITDAGLHRAALLLHQQVASSWQSDGLNDIDFRVRHFRSAIDCYIGDDDESFRKEVFEYVRKECSGAVNSEFSHGKPVTLRDALYTKLPALVELDALLTTRLVAELFVDDLDYVINRLENGDRGKAQYLFLHAIISGELVQLDPVAGSVLNLSMDHYNVYLKLMAKLYPDRVYEYLSTHDNYRAEDALRLCQEHSIPDASAYLLERTGKVTSALQLILQTLESRMMSLKRTIRGLGMDAIRQSTSRNSHSTKGAERKESTNMVAKNEVKEIEGVKRILVVALDLCERNSGGSSVREHGSQLWFNVLDRLINAKGFLRLSKEQPEHAKVMGGVLSELLRMTMQRMVSSVPLTDLVRKVTSDNSGSRLGELREMLESLLETYGFELNVFSNAVEAFREDVRTMRTESRTLKLSGSGVTSVMNTRIHEGTASSIVNLTRGSEALVVHPHGHAHILDGSSLPYSQRVESNLTAAMSRLRSRNTTKSRHRVGLSLAPVKHDDELPCDDRAIGALSEAQHRGRLMTFY